MTRAEFTSLIGGEQKQLRRFLLALCCGIREDAEDLAQETLIKAYLASGKFTDTEKFTAWIYRIAYNCFIDHCRNHKPFADMDEAKHTVDEQNEAPDYTKLYAALHTLPPKERTAILLYYLKGYRVKEIAGILKCSDNAVKKQMSRGREQLKLKLQ
ncbi:MAG: RNA polymerase sigma factor [Bacteroidales bacterium]|nr:RNA polymerase sigma factor [Bacteroidales bacterium]